MRKQPNADGNTKLDYKTLCTILASLSIALFTKFIDLQNKLNEKETEISSLTFQINQLDFTCRNEVLVLKSTYLTEISTLKEENLHLKRNVGDLERPQLSDRKSRQYFSSPSTSPSVAAESGQERVHIIDEDRGSNIVTKTQLKQLDNQPNSSQDSVETRPVREVEPTQGAHQ